MKITIDGEPKEIAAYELALKDGKAETYFATINAESVKDFSEIAEMAQKHCQEHKKSMQIIEKDLSKQVEGAYESSEKEDQPLLDH